MKYMVIVTTVRDLEAHIDGWTGSERWPNGTVGRDAAAAWLWDLAHSDHDGPRSGDDWRSWLDSVELEKLLDVAWSTCGRCGTEERPCDCCPGCGAPPDHNCPCAVSGGEM